MRFFSGNQPKLKLLTNVKNNPLCCSGFESLPLQQSGWKVKAQHGNSHTLVPPCWSHLQNLPWSSIYIHIKGVITSLAEVVPGYKSHPCCSSKDRINWRMQQTLVGAAISLWRQNHLHLQAQSSVSLFPLKSHTACVAATAVFPESLVQLHKTNFYKISFHGSRLH